jgi:hypothetical protein
LCPACAQLNWNKRVATADLKGYIALVTGGRVKIGYSIHSPRRTYATIATLTSCLALINFACMCVVSGVLQV